ncbi:MAG: ATP synthase F1 subunit epsilon [Phycisphaerae bacterium]
MADGKTLRCLLITPEQQVLECDATMVALPVHDGEMGFLTNRAPLLCKLGVGELRVSSVDGDQRFFLDSGFAQMLNNELTILTEGAEAASDIDLAQVEKELQDASAMPAADPALRKAKDLAVARAKARKRVALSRR